MVGAVKAHNSMMMSTSSEVLEQFMSIYTESGIPSSSPADCINQIITVLEKSVTCPFQELGLAAHLLRLASLAGLQRVTNHPGLPGLGGFPERKPFSAKTGTVPNTQQLVAQLYLFLITLEFSHHQG